MSEYYNNAIQQGELSDGAVIGADQLGDYTTGTFVLLPEGDYDFTVVNLSTSRYNPKQGSKIGACKSVTITMRVADPVSGTDVDLKHNLYMWNSQACVGMIAQYQDSIGIHKMGEPLSFDWRPEVHIGKKGRLKIGHRTYKGRDGSDYQSNDIKKLYPKEVTSAHPSGWQSGRF